MILTFTSCRLPVSEVPVPYPPWFSHEACHLVRGLLKLSCEKCAEGLAISMNMGGVPKIRVPQKRWMVKNSGKSYIRNLDDELWVFPPFMETPILSTPDKDGQVNYQLSLLVVAGNYLLGDGDLGVHFQTKHMGASIGLGDTQYWMVDRENPSTNR